MEQLRLGLTNPQIAERLGITADGVKYHISNMLAKLGLESREDLAAWEGDPEAAPVPWWRAGLIGWFARGWVGRVAAGVVALAVAALAGVLIVVVVYGWPDESAGDGRRAPSAVDLVPATGDGDIVFTARRDGEQAIITFVPPPANEPAQGDAVFAWTSRERVRRLIQPALDFGGGSGQVTVRVPAGRRDGDLTIEFAPELAIVEGPVEVELQPDSGGWSGTATIERLAIPVRASLVGERLEIRSAAPNSTPFMLVFTEGASLTTETGETLARTTVAPASPTAIPPVLTLTGLWPAEPWSFEPPDANESLRLVMPQYVHATNGSSVTFFQGDLPELATPPPSEAPTLASTVEQYLEVNLGEAPYVGDCPGRDQPDPTGVCTDRVAGRGCSPGVSFEAIAWRSAPSNQRGWLFVRNRDGEWEVVARAPLDPDAVLGPEPEVPWPPKTEGCPQGGLESGGE